MALNLFDRNGLPLVSACLVLDFNGTLACDGSVIAGVSERVEKIAKDLRVYVVTADTFGTAQAALKHLAVEVRVIQDGADKERIVSELGDYHTVVIGNGRNDVRMFKIAGLGIAVLGPEGLAGELAACASVIVPSIESALDLLLEPKRLKATLRP